jgi:lipid-A-disaccharide synthase
VDTIVDSETSASVMGVAELFGSLSKIVAAYRRLLNWARNERPDFVVLVDYPDFNLRLARDLKRAGIRVFYFISPQIWAWRQGRVKTIKKYVDRVATIFPFEIGFYHEHGVDAEFIGHPFLDRDESGFDREQFMRSVELDPQKPVLAFLPGSRTSEIERLVAPMRDAFTRLKQEIPGLQAMLPVAPGLDLQELQGAFQGESVSVFEGRAFDALRAADASVVASGTATIEAALAGRPFMVVYKLAPLTYRIGRLLVTGVKNFAMVNLVAGEQVVNEYLQDEVTGDNIAAELKRLLTDDDAARQMCEKLKLVRRKLRVQDELEIGAGERAARMALAMIEGASDGPN